MPSLGGQDLPSGEFFTSADVISSRFLQPLPITSAARAKPSIITFVFVAFITFVTPNRALAHLARSVDVADSVHANRGASSSDDVHLLRRSCQPKPRPRRPNNWPVTDPNLEPLSYRGSDALYVAVGAVRQRPEQCRAAAR